LKNIYNNSMYLRVSFRLTTWQHSWEFLYKSIELLQQGFKMLLLLFKGCCVEHGARRA